VSLGNRDRTIEKYLEPSNWTETFALFEYCLCSEETVVLEVESEFVVIAELLTKMEQKKRRTGSAQKYTDL
jgi:hypothetical protein